MTSIPAPVPISASLPPRPRSLGPKPIEVQSSGVPTFPIKLVVALALVGAFVFALWFGVQKMRVWGDDTVEEAATRPYPSPNRLVIAAVTKEYGSSITDDGAVLLQKMPRGPAAGLAGFYRGDIVRTANAIEQGLAALPGATYRGLDAPTAPCRSDAETAVSTLGEVTVGDAKITLFTCTLTKKNNAYFLAWAASSADVDGDKKRLTYFLKTSQLVNHDVCAMDVINGGCSPSASGLVTAIVTSARR